MAFCQQVSLECQFGRFQRSSLNLARTTAVLVESVSEWRSLMAPGHPARRCAGRERQRHADAVCACQRRRPRRLGDFDCALFTSVVADPLPNGILMVVIASPFAKHPFHFSTIWLRSPCDCGTVSVGGGGAEWWRRCSLLVAPAVFAATVLFPRPLHLVRRVDDPISKTTATIDEYCGGNRVVTVRGSKVAIADYDAQQLTEIDHAAQTWSVTPLLILRSRVPISIRGLAIRRRRIRRGSRPWGASPRVMLR